MELFEAYHRRTSQQHQEAFDRLSRQGFRMISLNVYGAPPDPRYAAVWVQRAGPEFLAFHGVRAADYQSRFDQALALGYSPVLVTATGSGAATIFAAYFERGVRGPWIARHDLSLTDFVSVDATAVQGGMALRSLAVSGTTADPRYAAVWHPRRAGVITHLRALNETADYQKVFEAETSLPFFRPRLVSVAEDRRLGAVFSNDFVGRWAALHALTASQYQHEFDHNVARGLVPICVSGGGIGANVRFAAIFAERDIPLSRVWSATGTRPPELAATEQLVEDFMKARSVRCAQLTILKKGEIALERAYTWSEPGTRKTGVRDLMLLASNSKIFAAAAVYRLCTWFTGRNLRPRLTPNRRVYPLLGFTGPMDMRCDQITVEQLILHRSGYPRDPDPTYDMRTIANDLGLSRAPTATEVARRIYASRNLLRDPGPEENEEYANMNYLLASLVVEKVSGIPFLEFVRKHLLAPLGITDVDVCPTAGPAGRPANQILPEDDGLGLTTLRPTDNIEVPVVFGGDGMSKETAIGSCGLASSATALARFIHQYAVQGMGPRTFSRRNGATPGCLSEAISRDPDVDWVLIINTRVNISGGDWNQLIQDIGESLDEWAPRPLVLTKKSKRPATPRAKKSKRRKYESV